MSVCETHNLEYCGKCFYDFREMNLAWRMEAETLDSQEKSLQCARIDCSKYGEKICNRCKLVRYCSVECQKNCWKEHKKSCKAVTQRDLPDSTSNLVGKVNIGFDSDDIVDVLPIGTKVALYHGMGETKGVIKAFNVGRGPFQDPLVRADPSQHKDWLMQMADNPCSCLPHYSIKCGDSTVELHEASSVHHDWIVLGADGNPIITGIEDTIEVDETPVDLSGLVSKFVLVSGLMFSHENCFYSRGLQKVLSEDDLVDRYTAIDLKKAELIEILSSGIYTCCVLFGLGSSGPQGLKQVYHEDLRKTITKWIKAGGVFIIQGEGCISKVFKDWFKLPWTPVSYERSVTELNRRCTSVPSRTFDKLPSSNSVKAVYLAGVKDEHNLYKSGKNSAVAFAPIGKGRVCFIGDVNAEENTLEIIHQLGLLGEDLGEPI
jgi:hypothetical protein